MYSFLGLLAALGVVASATFISMWLLRIILPDLFWAIIIANLTSAFMGICLSSYVTKDCQNRLTAELVNIACAVTLSMLVCGLVIKGLISSVPVEEDVAFWIAKTLTALFGVAMDTSLFFLLLRCAVMMVEARQADFRRLGRQIRGMSCWAPRAKVLFCKDLEAAAPGNCAICLEGLIGELPECRSRGLLRLPCGHVFHGACAEPWLVREATCPMCRQPVDSLRECVRLQRASSLQARAAPEAGLPAAAEAGSGGGGEHSTSTCEPSVVGAASAGAQDESHDAARSSGIPSQQLPRRGVGGEVHSEAV